MGRASDKSVLDLNLSKIIFTFPRTFRIVQLNISTVSVIKIQIHSINLFLTQGALNDSIICQ